MSWKCRPTTKSLLVVGKAVFSKQVAGSSSKMYERVSVAKLATEDGPARKEI